MERIMLLYVTYLLKENTIQFTEIIVTTIEGYMTAVNVYYKGKNLPLPWQRNGNTAANGMLKKTGDF